MGLNWDIAFLVHCFVKWMEWVSRILQTSEDWGGGLVSGRYKIKKMSYIQITAIPIAIYLTLIFISDVYSDSNWC